MGLLLITLLSVSLTRWGMPALPSGGATSAVGGGDLLDRLAHLVMPATVLAFYYVAVWSRYTRSSMLEVLTQDYVRTARSKGLTERTVVYVHALRNAVAPLITLIGLQLPTLFSGSVVVETVFTWPGIGRLAVERALQFDHTVVLGLTTFAAVLVLVGSLLADILYAVLDPRIRYA
jgi:peptide/nickel transport system permease protein